MKKNTTLFLTFLMLSIFSIVSADPAPEDTPIDFAQAGGGPPPPPPAPIDTHITLLLMASIVLAFMVFFLFKKKPLN